MLGAVIAAVDQRHAEVDEFVELAVERSAYAGVEGKKVLQHLRTVGQGFVDIAGFAAESFFVNLVDFGRGGFRGNQGDAGHRSSRGDAIRAENIIDTISIGQIILEQIMTDQGWDLRVERIDIDPALRRPFRDMASPVSRIRY